MKITKLSDTSPISNPHGVDARKLYDSQHAQAVVITLEPGQRLKRHITPVDVFFYVLEGEGIVEIGMEKEQVGSDTLIESPAGIPHCWYNQSTARLKVLVVKVPRPSKPTKVL